MALSIGLFYASTTGNTEQIADQIAAMLPDCIHLHDIAVEGVAAMAEYRCLILGIPTWDFGELQEDWAEHWEELSALDLSGKRVALFGLGDQLGYGEWFQDAMGLLDQQVRNAGAQVVVHWPVVGYQFEASKALTEDGQYFVGLALDEDGQHGETEERLQHWLPQVISAFEA
ncbi:flavodoxin FldB [Marinobacterium sediminicola]|uniref:Flavodoxin n=1 Tax=Marinobacterium sediminicola TaxID=518898 RepID=A0ABY1S3K9_9GAMM|nr:flavodoxin FldB [Marinobacterium sediminicola]ULG69861.1 flavodoxin FldB [Marinobacterium sediminicola]SMR77859.1 flavodoxin II [Marinobacterium sediminicola]